MDKVQHTTTRREFIKQSTVAAAGVSIGLSQLKAASYKRVQGANDKIRMGFIGIGNRGTQLLNRFMDNEDVQVVALCDAYQPYLERDYAKVDARLVKELGGRIPKMGESFGSDVGRYKDFRRLLERKDMDAVCIATPDHWHAIQTIDALEAGKDIYVEKPLTIALKEGRAMVDAVERTGRIVQVGLNRRGSTVYRDLAPQIQSGKIGKVTLSRAYRISNMYPNGIGNAQPESPPDGFDWDMWVGPRAFRSYQYNIAPYKFRWWKDYSTQMGNWGVHYMDAIRWLIGERAPVAITAHGGQYVLKDDRDIPDTMEVTFEFASGTIISFGIYEASGGRMIEGGEVELRGAIGNLVVDENGYKISPNGVGQFQERGDLIEEVSRQLEPREDITVNLIRNFLDCVKSRSKESLWCPIEEGHRSTSFAHLANIALETGTRIEWNPEREVITNNKQANKLLAYKYRKPWRLL